MPAKKSKKYSASILDQLAEVARMTDKEQDEVSADPNRPRLVKRYIDAIDNGEISDTLKILKEVSKMNEAEVKVDVTSIENLAIGDNDEAYCVAMIKQSVGQMLRPNATPQEIARLQSIVNIFRNDLREIRSRAPKDGTLLARVLNEVNMPKKVEKSPSASKVGPVKKKKAVSKPAVATKKKKTASKSAKVVKKSGK